MRAWRAGGRSVAVLAVDPSSRRSGGSLLGDRARIPFDPADAGVFIRSTAAAGRLGGLAPATRAAAHALAAAFDVVVVETVGVGQSETDVAEVADTVAVIVQPGSGDVLQFLKAGIMEIPDVLVVTKADLGDVAQRARRDLHAALRSLGDRETEVVAVSSIAPVTGIDELVAALDAHRARLDLPARRLAARRAERAGRLRRRARRARPARPGRAARGRARAGRRRPGRRRAGARRRPRRSGGRRVIRGILFLLAVFVVVTAIAALLGAANLGTAATFGQIAFAAALVWLLLNVTRRRARRDLHAALRSLGDRETEVVAISSIAPVTRHRRARRRARRPS